MAPSLIRRWYLEFLRAARRGLKQWDQLALHSANVWWEERMREQFGLQDGATPASLAPSAGHAPGSRGSERETWERLGEWMQGSNDDHDEETP